MEAVPGSLVVITGTVVGRHADGGVEYVRIKGKGYEAYDQTALVPLAWVGEVIAQKELDTHDQSDHAGSDV